MVRYGNNGFKTQPNVSRWVDCVERLRADEPLRGRHGGNAKSFAGKYDVETFGREMGRIYAYVLALREQRNGKERRSDYEASSRQCDSRAIA